MFSLIFPGQGSQSVGMGRDLYSNYTYIKALFDQADETLGFKLSQIILEGPKEDLDLTEYTQPAIFLVGYSIFQVALREFNLSLKDASFAAGHSLGEYTALTCLDSIKFSDGLKILKIRGKSMQEAVPIGEGGMIAVIGVEINELEKIISENKSNFNCFIANDNTVGQVVVSGKIKDLQKFIEVLKDKKIKNIKLPVSAPFHCPLMNIATKIMSKEIEKIEIKTPKIKILSNVNAKVATDIKDLKRLLISQIESRVRWRETINTMIYENCHNFVEIGPGRVLSGMIKRIAKDLNVSSISSVDDLKNFKSL